MVVFIKKLFFKNWLGIYNKPVRVISKFDLIKYLKANVNNILE